VAVAVLSLMGAGVVAQVGSRAITGDGPFVDASNSRGVVRGVGDSGVAEVLLASHEGDLGQQAGLLQIAVRYSSCGVIRGDEPGLHFLGKRVPPNIALSMGIEVDPTHAGLRSIGGANKGRDLWHDLGKVSGPVAQAGCEGSEGVEVLAQTFVDAYSVSTGSIEG
jgi:hypothetical protein